MSFQYNWFQTTLFKIKQIISFIIAGLNIQKNEIFMHKHVQITYVIHIIGAGLFFGSYDARVEHEEIG